MCRIPQDHSFARWTNIIIKCPYRNKLREFTSNCRCKRKFAAVDGHLLMVKHLQIFAFLNTLMRAISQLWTTPFLPQFFITHSNVGHMRSFVQKSCSTSSRDFKLNFCKLRQSIVLRLFACKNAAQLPRVTSSQRRFFVAKSKVVSRKGPR